MLLKPRQLAERLNVSLSTVYGLIETGKIACHRIGRGRGAVRVSEEDLTDYLASCRNAEKNQTKPPRPRVKLKHLKL